MIFKQDHCRIGLRCLSGTASEPHQGNTKIGCCLVPSRKHPHHQPMLTDDCVRGHFWGLVALFVTPLGSFGFYRLLTFIPSYSIVSWLFERPTWPFAERAYQHDPQRKVLEWSSSPPCYRNLQNLLKATCWREGRSGIHSGERESAALAFPVVCGVALCPRELAPSSSSLTQQ